MTTLLFMEKIHIQKKTKGCLVDLEKLLHTVHSDLCFLARRSRFKKKLRICKIEIQDTSFLERILQL